MDINELILEIESNNIEIAINDSGNLNVVLPKSSSKNQALIDKIKANKALLIKHIRGETAAGEIPGCRLTPFQEGLLTFAINNADSHRYIIRCSFDAKAPLPFEVFRKASEYIFSQHEILRTAFDVEPHRHGFKTRILPIDTLCCSRLSASGYDAFINSPFSVSGPLIRFALVEDQQIVLLTHCLIADEQAVELLAAALLDACDQIQKGLLPKVEGGASFAAYSDWLFRQDRTKAKSYWQDQLKNIEPAMLENVIVHERAVKRENYAKLRLGYQLNDETGNFLQQLSITSDSALHFFGGLVLSAYYGGGKFVWGDANMHRYSGMAGFASTIGPLQATVPLVYDFNRPQTVMESMQEFRHQLLQAREHSSLSLNEIYNTVKTPDLFSICFSFRNNPREIAVPNAVWGFQSYFPLFLQVSLSDDAVVFDVSYRTDLFPEMLVRNFTALIVGLYNNFTVIKEQLLSKLDVFEESIQRSHIAGLPTTVPSDSLLSLFAKSLQLYPNDIAVEDIENNSLTYTMLEETSNHIANILTGKGVKGAVGIYLNYSAKLIVTVLGVLKAGCSIVSLEHGFPMDKLKWLAMESQLSACLLEERDRVVMNDILAGELSSCLIIALPEELPQAVLNVSPAHPLPDDICILYYTSGSTGIPKIVSTSHGNILNGLEWLKQQFPAGRRETFCMNIRLSFSPSIRNIFEALSQGARLLVIPESLYHNVDKFSQLVADKQVTRISLTPSFVKVLMANDKMKWLQQINILELRGEAVKMSDVGPIRNALPNAVVINRYGATEASSIAYNQHYNSSFEYYPLGKPVCNTAISIVDDYLRVRPLNVIGEILIAGRSVSLGYFRSPDDKDTFLLQPDGSRCLKTGDLGFIDMDGVLHYIGRKNRMLKLRGYRIEPSEIEYNLEQFEGVRKAEVVVMNKGEGTRLVTFCLVDDPGKFSEDHLKQFLTERLPAYTIPGRILFLKEFPRTATGKIDHETLQDNLVKESWQKVAAPTTTTERQVHAIFAALMPDTPISLHEDLYAMGANSIVLMRAAFKLGAVFNIKLKGAELFTYNTIGKLASHIEKAANSNKLTYEKNYYTVNQQEGSKHILFLIPPLTGPSVYQELSAFMPDKMDFVMFDTIRMEDYRTFGRNMEALAGFYKNLILQLAKDKMIHIAGWSFGASLAFEVALQLEALGRKVNSLILFDSGIFSLNVDSKGQCEDDDQIIHNILEQAHINLEDADAAMMIEQLKQACRLIGKYRPSRKYSGNISLIQPVHLSPLEESDIASGNISKNYCAGEVTVSTTKEECLEIIPGSVSSLAEMIFSRIVWM
ncbi:AMP-binding protein [Chitinophaga sp. OAE865]|uniref:AMP-binding protein n=1 Tax=Chitinophaga sp. OAE865 TaxID=2817898 RepID=UPI001AE17DE4